MGDREKEGDMEIHLQAAAGYSYGGHSLCNCSGPICGLERAEHLCSRGDPRAGQQYPIMGQLCRCRAGAHRVGAPDPFTEHLCLRFDVIFFWLDQLSLVTSVPSASVSTPARKETYDRTILQQGCRGGHLVSVMKTPEELQALSKGESHRDQWQEGDAWAGGHTWFSSWLKQEWACKPTVCEPTGF